MFTITENLLKIGPVLSEVVGGNDHSCCVVRKPIDVTLVIFGITELIFFKFVQNVAKILPLNIFNWNCDYSIPFGRPACQMKVSLPIVT